VSLLWTVAATDPYEEFNQQVDAEHAKPGKEFKSATDECQHCGRPILWDPANEFYTAKGMDGNDCSVKGAFAHEP
jgi:hypothetical protein